MTRTMARKPQQPPPLQPREFRSTQEIDLAIAKLRRRIEELEKLDVPAAMAGHTGAIETAGSNVRTAILEVFGEGSPEYREHQYVHIWQGPQYLDMDRSYIAQCIEQGRPYVIGILNGLIGRLEEKRAEFGAAGAPPPSGYYDHLNLHPRIREVSRDLFMDGHHWQAVFEASKVLVNYVKDRSGQHSLDGAALMRTVFSKNDPILAFNDLKDQTDLDEQEGTMHLFEGVVLAIRNPGGHSFPEGPEQRAIEEISFLSMLAYRVQEAKRRK